MGDIKSTDIKRIARHMRQLKEDGKSTVLLVGAGISVTAGVPLAGKMIEELKADEKYNYQLDGLDNKDASNEYNAIMRELTSSQRQEYIRHYIDTARINLTHLYIGSLIKEGLVDCVLTTNFDPLLVKTMGLFNHHTYVYDLANAKRYTTSSIMHPNIFYLHGQGHAFLMLNTEDELKEPQGYIKSLLNDMKQRHFFLVVGYSGLCDFVFQELCEADDFPNDLHWVGYESEVPPKHVKEQLCCNGSVRYMNSTGSDSFFRDLHNELKLPLPPFVDKPFHHLKGILDNIGELAYDDGKQTVPVHILLQPQQKLDAAIELVENHNMKMLEKELEKLHLGKLPEEVEQLFLKGKNKEIVAKSQAIMETHDEATIEKLAWAYVLLGNKLADSGDFEASATKYAKAVEVKPDMHDAWYNWGNALKALAETKGGDEALYQEAFEKYTKAIEIKPDKYEAWNNWGTALMALATAKGDDEALYQQAFEKYAKAVEIKPDKHEAWNNWGYALDDLAEARGGDEALYRQAFEKYAKAVEIKPDKYEALNNWGIALSKLYGVTKQIEYLHEAVAKFENANKHKAHHSDYNLACAYTLQGDTQKGLSFLTSSLEHGATRMTREKIEQDEDLAALRPLPAFKQVLDKYLPIEENSPS